jgi:hypothetical protein
MSRKVLLWAMALVVIIPALIGTGYWIWWDQFKRYAPVTVTRNQAEIQVLLDKAGYVSPGRGPQAIYVITHRSCETCRAFQEQEFPKYDAAGVDTRVIVFAPADDQGLKRSTSAERSTIAELWLTRSWPIYQAWFMSSDANWKATGLPVADNDFARSAVVDATRNYVSQMSTLLSANNVRVAYPLVIWRDQNNMLKVCACGNEKAYHFIREDLSVPNNISGREGPMFDIPENVLEAFGASSSSAPKPAPAPVQVAPKAVPAPKPVPAAKPAAAAVPASAAAKPATTQVQVKKTETRTTSQTAYPTDFGPDS